MESLSQSIIKVFCLKNAVFSTFDSSQLSLAINKTQERVLMMSWRHTKATMQFLSREAGLEKGSLTGVIDSLESLGLVERIRAEEDRRSFIIEPTAQGRELAEKIDVLFRAHLETILRTLPDEDRADFERAIITLARLIPRL